MTKRILEVGLLIRNEGARKGQIRIEARQKEVDRWVASRKAVNQPPEGGEITPSLQLARDG